MNNYLDKLPQNIFNKIRSGPFKDTQVINEIIIFFSIWLSLHIYPPLSKYLEKFTKNIQIYRINIFLSILFYRLQIKIKIGIHQYLILKMILKENIYLRKIHLTKNTFNSFFL